MSNRLNKYKYPGAKRLMLEAQELKDKTEDYCAQPIDDNLFEWHFTVRGPPDTAFEGGFYHGRLSFPTEYPMKPPSIILFNPNGRFEINKKICLSISGFHPETWQPSWSVRTALLALIAFMPTKGNKAIGALDYSDPERRKLAKNSKTWRCETCGPIKDLLKQPEDPNKPIDDQQCKTGAIRAYQDGNNPQSDGSQNDRSSPSDRSDSEGEMRDSSTDPHRSASSSYIPDSDRTTASSSSSYQELRSLAGSADTELGSKFLQGENAPDRETLEQAEPDPVATTTLGHDQQTTMSTTGRASCPQYVLISIFILLFLLIVRRIVMILQS